MFFADEYTVGGHPFQVRHHIALLELTRRGGRNSVLLPASLLTIRSFASPIFSMVPKSLRERQGLCPSR